jgi:hypothetical protein
MSTKESDQELRELFMESTDGTRKAHHTPDGVEYVPMITVDLAIETTNQVLRAREAEHKKELVEKVNALEVQHTVKFGDVLRWSDVIDAIGAELVAQKTTIKESSNKESSNE